MLKIFVLFNPQKKSLQKRKEPENVGIEGGKNCPPHNCAPCKDVTNVARQNLPWNWRKCFCEGMTGCTHTNMPGTKCDPKSSQAVGVEEEIVAEDARLFRSVNESKIPSTSQYLLIFGMNMMRLAGLLKLCQSLRAILTSWSYIHLNKRGYWYSSLQSQFIFQSFIHLSELMIVNGCQMSRNLTKSRSLSTRSRPSTSANFSGATLLSTVALLLMTLWSPSLPPYQQLVQLLLWF